MIRGSTVVELSSGHALHTQRREPRDHMAQVAIVAGRIHPVGAPMALVVRVKQDDVRFDAEVAQLADPLLEMAEKIGVETGEIPLRRRGAGEGIARRFVFISLVPFRKSPGGRARTTGKDFHRGSSRSRKFIRRGSNTPKLSSASLGCRSLLAGDV